MEKTNQCFGIEGVILEKIVFLKSFWKLNFIYFAPHKFWFWRKTNDLAGINPHALESDGFGRALG